MITRIALAWLAVLIAVPLAAGRDEPKKAEQPTPQEQYNQLVKKFSEERRQLVAEINKVQGEERTKLIEKYQAQGKEYADQFLKLAEDHPKDPVSTSALFWVLQNAGANKKAEEQIVARIPDMPVAELRKNLPPATLSSAAILEAVAERAEKASDDPAAGDLLGWLATVRVFPGNAKTAEIAKAATERLLEKFPDNPAVLRICQTLARSSSEKDMALLKSIAAKSTSPKVQAEATFGLGQMLSSKLDKLADKPAELEKAAAEADKVLATAVDLFAKAELNTRKEAAELELKAFRTTRVGVEAPEIEGDDLDGQKFKLSDYRGKVVLLDFWGDW